MSAKCVNLFLEKNRLKTFKKWPFKHPNKCTKENLAAAGFHFIGKKKEPDLVQCVVCFKELDGWEEDDDPWEEHSRRTSCPFIALNKTEDKMTIEDLASLIRNRMTIQAEKDYESAVTEIEEKSEEYKEIISKYQPS